MRLDSLLPIPSFLTHHHQSQLQLQREVFFPSIQSTNRLNQIMESEYLPFWELEASIGLASNRDSPAIVCCTFTWTSSSSMSISESDISKYSGERRWWLLRRDRRFNQPQASLSRVSLISENTFGIATYETKRWYDTVLVCFYGSS